MEKEGQEPVPVQAETVALQQVQPNWSYSGELRPDTEVQLAFNEPGYIASLYRVKGADGRMRDVQVGDEIPASAVLAHLRSSDYEASFTSAVGQQQAMQGAFEASQAELDRAKASKVKADLDFDRAQGLYAANAMTRPDYDSAVEQHTAATASVELRNAADRSAPGPVERRAGAGCVRANQPWRYKAGCSDARESLLRRVWNWAAWLQPEPPHSGWMIPAW